MSRQFSGFLLADYNYQTMPAIQYRMHGTIVVVRDPKGFEAINLWSKKGTLIEVLWLGFMTRYSADMMTGGGWGRMPAVAVSSASTPICGWRPVEPDQFVLCYRVPQPQVPSGWGAYAILDVEGWPIVMTPRPTVNSPKPK